MKKKILYGAAGALGVGIVSWKTFFPWIGYDLELVRKIGAIKNAMEKSTLQKDFVIDKFERNVLKQPHKVMIIHEDAEYTFQFINEQANRVANVVKSWNVKVGEAVAIMIYNEPAFVWTFIGLQKLGIAVAMINFNIRKDALAHCVLTSEAKYLIVGQGQELLDAVEDVKHELKMPIYVQGSHEYLPEEFLPFDPLMSKAYPVPVSKVVRQGMDLTTTMCYIYTSGTTGLPKAATIKQLKGIGFSFFMELSGANENDILYTALPLYHSAGGALGFFGVMATGSTMVLRNKFSAHHFFDDCRKHNVTVVQYIGELFRYLLLLPESPLDNQHKIRLAVGNGLRKDIWEKFQKRFNIPVIMEFFGATEGPGAYVNLNNKIGSVGRHSPILNKLDPYPKVLVEYDHETGMPIRDKNGRCIKIKAGEAGLLLCVVPPDIVADGAKFYKAKQEENEKKLVRNAFVDGDIYFNFGDVLYLDKDYFVYFNDRIGDTFRWKGENVSTTEVANSLTHIEFIEDANVYGVTVPGSEGKAGMAAVFLTNREDAVTEDMLQIIHKTCSKQLPSYARPMFLRFAKNVVLTSTYKHKKVEFRKEAYDPNVVNDPLYFRDDKLNKYVPLTQDVYNMLQMAKARL